MPGHGAKVGRPAGSDNARTAAQRRLFTPGKRGWEGVRGMGKRAIPAVSVDEMDRRIAALVERNRKAGTLGPQPQRRRGSKAARGKGARHIA